MFSNAVKYVKEASVPYRKTPEQQLIRAIYNGDNNLLRTLLNDGVSPNTLKNRQGNPPRFVGKSALIIAIERNNREAIELLLNAPGIDVDLREISSYTSPLMLASTSDANRDLLNELVKKGAYVKLPDREGNSALFYAAATFSINNINFLLSRGADLNLPNNQGFTPLTFILALNKNSDTVDENYLNTIQLLLEHGAELGNALDIDKRPEVLDLLSKDPKSRPPLNLLPVPPIEAISIPIAQANRISRRPFGVPNAKVSVPQMATAVAMDNEEEKINGGKLRHNKKYKNKSKKGKQYKNKNKSIRRKK